MKENKKLVGTITNGTRYVLENTKCGNKISIIMGVNVGSRDELDEYKGISHFLEHMLFRGTKKYPTSELLNEKLYKLGGYFNASTHYEKTQYEITISKQYLKVALDILSELLYHSLLKPKDFAIEKKIIINEYNEQLSNPYDKRWDSQSKVVFKDTRLEIPIIGTLQTINKITPKLLHQFMNIYYQPENIIISIAGDISFTTTKQMIETYFSKQVAYSVPVHKIMKEDSQRILYPCLITETYPQSPRTKHIPFSEEQSYISISFPAYEYNNEKTWTLLLLSELLTGNHEVSRLFKLLRANKGLIYNIYSEYNPIGNDIGLFTIDFETTNNQKSDNIEHCLYLLFNELLKLINKGVTDKELSLGKSHIIESLHQDDLDVDSISEKNLNNISLINRVRNKQEIIQKYKSVTKNMIHEVCKDIFKLNKCSLVYLSHKKIF